MGRRNKGRRGNINIESPNGYGKAGQQRKPTSGRGFTGTGRQGAAHTACCNRKRDSSFGTVRTPPTDAVANGKDVQRHDAHRY